MGSILESQAFELVQAEGVSTLFVGVESIRERQGVLLRECLLGVCRPSPARVAVGLLPVLEMSSSAIAALMEAGARCESSGGGLALFGVHARLRSMLRATGLDSSLIIAADHPEAIRSLLTPRRRTPFWRRAA